MAAPGGQKDSGRGGDGYRRGPPGADCAGACAVGLCRDRRPRRIFGVSEMTVRRDLDSLAQERLVERAYGGAVARSGDPAARIDTIEPGLDERDPSQQRRQGGNRPDRRRPDRRGPRRSPSISAPRPCAWPIAIKGHECYSFHNQPEDRPVPIVRHTPGLHGGRRDPRQRTVDRRRHGPPADRILRFDWMFLGASGLADGRALRLFDRGHRDQTGVDRARPADGGPDRQLQVQPPVDGARGAVLSSVDVLIFPTVPPPATWQRGCRTPVSRSGSPNPNHEDRMIFDFFGDKRKAVIAMAPYRRPAGLAALRRGRRHGQAGRRRDRRHREAAGRRRSTRSCSATRNDRPYLLKATPESIAAMTAVVSAAQAGAEGPVRDQLLVGPTASVSIGVATPAASFVREIFTGVFASDMGMWAPDCATAVRGCAAIFGRRDLKLLFNHQRGIRPRAGRTGPIELRAAQAPGSPRWPTGSWCPARLTGQPVDASSLRKVAEVIEDCCRCSPTPGSGSTTWRTS